MFQPSVHTGKHDGFTAVVVTDKIRRRPVCASNLEDDCGMVMNSDDLALEMQTVARYGSHSSSPLVMILRQVCTSVRALGRDPIDVGQPKVAVSMTNR